MHRYRITLDTNSLIDLEEGHKRAAYLERIIKGWRRGEVEIAVVAISASERLKNGKYASSFEEFQRRLERLGLHGIDILKPMVYLDITFWDYCLYSDGTMENLERQINTILFPTIPFHLPKGADDRMSRKWLNAKCDVQLMWAHIWYQRDIFVTSDKNFHKRSKRPRLIKLGAKHIETPASTVKLLVAP